MSLFTPNKKGEYYNSTFIEDPYCTNCQKQMHTNDEVISFDTHKEMGGICLCIECAVKVTSSVIQDLEQYTTEVSGHQSNKVYDYLANNSRLARIKNLIEQVELYKKFK